MTAPIAAGETLNGLTFVARSACDGLIIEVRRATAEVPTTMPRPVLPVGGIALDVYLEQVERSLTEQALERAAGRKAVAARLLGINRTTLVERLRRLGGEAARTRTRRRGHRTR